MRSVFQNVTLSSRIRSMEVSRRLLLTTHERPGDQDNTDEIVVLACVIDVITAVIPQVLLWNVQMAKKTKMSLNIIFSLGLITAGLSIGRVATINYGVVSDDTSCGYVLRFQWFSTDMQQTGLHQALHPPS